VNEIRTDRPAFYRLRDIIGDRRAEPPVKGLLPIAPSTWWDMIARGVAPRPTKLGRASLWRAADVHELIARLDRDGSLSTQQPPRAA
jgi:predicted DNA-binding transcriptional regulator AlpA